MLQELSTKMFDRYTRSTACVYFWWVIKNYLNQNKGIIRIRAWPIKSVSHWVVPETGGYGLWDWLNKTFLRRSRVSTRGIKLIYRPSVNVDYELIDKVATEKGRDSPLENRSKGLVWIQASACCMAQSCTCQSRYTFRCLYNTSLIQFIPLRKRCYSETKIFRKIQKNCCALNIKNVLDKTSKTYDTLCRECWTKWFQVVLINSW